MDNYGCNETNPVGNIYTDYLDRLDDSRACSWDDPELAKIVRLRLLSDPGYPVWDVSYCYGELTDGTLVSVSLPFSQLPKRGTNQAIVKAAIEDRVYATKLGIFDAISTLC